MRHRCRNPKNPFYKKFGAKGVTISDEWYDSFALFLADVGKRPTPKHTMGRIDKTLGYSKANCRWMTRTEQNLSRIQNKRGKAHPPITYNGETLTMSEWAKRIGITTTALSHRLGDYGWTLDEALGGKSRNAPTGRPRSHYVEHDGVIRHIKEWAAEAGLNPETFKSRRAAGWSWDRILTEPSMRKKRQ